MSRRRIGQESFGFGESGRGARSSLDDLAGLLDWAPVEVALSEISSAARGEPVWRPLALFKAMLISVWRDGSVCLNNFRAAVKWISALVTPPPGLASAG